MTTRSSALLAALLAGAPPPAAGQSVLARYALDGAPAWRAELPAALAEISGLAAADDGRLYAHGDEDATVFRFDLASRRVVERFGLAGSAGLLRGDFEDIELLDDRVFLVTSTGVIVEGRLAPDGRLSAATRRTSGFGDGCEVEGMTWDPPTRSLLLLCKQVKSRKWRDHVVVLAVSPVTWKFEPEPRLLVPEDRLRQVTGGKRFNGSAIVRHPQSGTYLLVAGPQRSYAEVDARGRVLGGGRLSRLHRQPEGLAVTPDLTLLVGDEAAGGAATITAYAFRP